MDWLEFISLGKPVDDVDTYLNHVSRWPLFVHMISALLCLGMSATFHLYYVYSPKASVLLARLDYTGIVLLNGGTTIPLIHYTFACPQVFCKTFTISLNI